MENQDKKFTSVSIPTQLFKKIEKRIKGTGFTSVSSYVIYVLREILAEESGSSTVGNRKEKKDEKEESSFAEATEDKKKEPFSKEDEEKIKDRLKNLGYL